MGDYNNDVDIQTIKDDNRKYMGYEQNVQSLPNSQNVCDLVQQTSTEPREDNTGFTSASTKPTVKRPIEHSKKRQKKVKPTVKSTDSNAFDAKKNFNAASTNPSSGASINQFIYNNISSMFNIQSTAPKANEDILSYLLPMYISEIRQQCDDILIGQLIQKVFSDDSYALNTIRTFCEFLNKNGYIIKKREIASQIFSSGSTAAASNESQKRTKDIINCPHTNRKHYAKNMCNNCYHKQGRAKRAWLCPHSKKAHYAKGLCQNCYLNQYHENKVMSNIVDSQEI